MTFEERSAEFDRLRDAGLFFKYDGATDTDPVHVSTPVMERMGLTMAQVTEVLDTPLWIPSKRIPSWADMLKAIQKPTKAEPKLGIILNDDPFANYDPNETGKDNRK